jgi:iron-sulfur cluster assembly protein
VVVITENAVMVIRDLAAQEGAPQTAGVRIAADPSGASLTIESAQQPAPGDRVVEDLGARLFLDSNAAELLEDKALDASVDEEGEVQFAVMDVPE